VVLAITKDNVDAPPTLFKTYDTSASLDSCTIWQVARATSAATTFFKSIKVGRDEIEFVDAGFGYNNPCEILIEEAQRQFPDRGQMCVLSIGTGLGDIVTIDNTRLSIINALKKMATSSKKVAARLNGRYGDNGQYYRLNVDQGLQDITLSDWDKASKISAHTRNYITENERAMRKFVENFTSMDQASDGNAGDSPHAVSGEAIDHGETRPQEVSLTTVGELSGSPSG
jgi:patatin-like phospholipase/acyl hydrolase